MLVEDPCLEAEVLRDLEQVEVVNRDALGITSDALEGPRTFDVMRNLRERFPSPPKQTYVFGSNPHLAYRLQYIMSLLYTDAMDVVFYKVEPGSLYPGYGRVVHETRLRNRCTISKKALASLGRNKEDRLKNILLCVYFLRTSLERPVYLSVIEDFVRAYLKKQYARNDARKIWRFCLNCELADAKPGYILERTSGGDLGQRRRVLLLRANDAGLSWAATNSNLATDDANLKDIDAMYSDMVRAGQLGRGGAVVDEKEFLSELCPVVQENSEVLSLFTGNFIRSKDAMMIGVPNPCTFSFPKVDPRFVQSLLGGNQTAREEGDASRRHMKLVNAHKADGDLLICCSSPRDLQAPATEVAGRVVERLGKISFEYGGSCPYKLGDLCTVSTPSEVMESIKEQVHPDLRQLKFPDRVTMKREEDDAA